MLQIVCIVHLSLSLTAVAVVLLAYFGAIQRRENVIFLFYFISYIYTCIANIDQSFGGWWMSWWPPGSHLYAQ
jgi:hypothetical protein